MKRFVFLCLFLAGAFMVPAVQAATITVNASDDTQTPGDGLCSLPEALGNASNNNETTSGDCAQGDTGLDEIDIDASLSGGTITLAGTTLTIITEAVTISGPDADDANGVTIDGNGNSRVFSILGSAPNEFKVTLNDMTLTGGNTGGNTEQGGALYALNADVEFNHVKVTASSTTGDNSEGGAVYVEDGDVTLNDCEFTDNFTTGYASSGGALTVWGGETTIKDCTFTGNSTRNHHSDGGAIYARGFADISGSILDGNWTEGDASEGGGLYVIVGAADIDGSRITNNYTEGQNAGGGGMYINGSLGNGDLDMVDTTVADNRAKGFNADGGGVRVNTGNVTINASTISGNATESSSAQGGGLNVNQGDVDLINSTVSGNSTSDSGVTGGGIYLVDGTATLRHSTVAYNQASGAFDGIFLGSGDDLVLENSLVIQQAAGETACSTVSNNSATASLATDTSCTGTATALADIKLQDLAANGGVTETHALLTGSVAIDTADATLCNALMPSEDQREVVRPVDGDDSGTAECDIGSFEYEPDDLDFGDAPSPYPTLLADDGAGHVIEAAAPILGALIDEEDDGQPGADAGEGGTDGDDADTSDDEDGVSFTAAMAGGASATVDVVVSGAAGLLNAWIDFNADGDWDDSGEQIFTDEALVVGSNSGLSFTVPATAVSGETFARFRLDTAGGLAPTGLASDGEVEDYKVAIAPPTVMFDSSVASPSAPEDAGTLVLAGAVRLSNPSSLEVTVEIELNAGSTATLTDDFSFTPATVTFAPGDTSADVEVTLVDDGVQEDNETAVFTLSNPSNATLGSPASVTTTIEDTGDTGSSTGSGSGNGSSGGDDDDDNWYGCAMGDTDGPVDPLLALLMLAAVVQLARRRLPFSRQEGIKDNT